MTTAADTRRHHRDRRVRRSRAVGGRTARALHATRANRRSVLKAGARDRDAGAAEARRWKAARAQHHETRRGSGRGWLRESSGRLPAAARAAASRSGGGAVVLGHELDDVVADGELAPIVALDHRQLVAAADHRRVGPDGRDAPLFHARGVPGDPIDHTTVPRLRYQPGNVERRPQGRSPRIATHHRRTYADGPAASPRRLPGVMRCGRSPTRE